MSQSHANDDKVCRRKHSFEKPWDPLQIATWFLYPLIVAHFFLLLVPLLWKKAYIQGIVIGLFVFAALASVIAAYVTCFIDPADDALRDGNAPGNGIPVIHRPMVENAEDKIYCYICEVHVHSTAKHCRYCDKCVVNFDHHCKWLNTCIGLKNYRAFVALVFSVGLMLSISVCLGVAFLVDAYSYGSGSAGSSSVTGADIEQRLASSSLLSAVGLPTVKGLLLGTTFVLVIILIMVFQLMSFHIMLMYQGITTYDFIISEQKRSREKKQAARAAAAAAARAATASNNNNNNTSSGAGAATATQNGGTAAGEGAGGNNNYAGAISSNVKEGILSNFPGGWGSAGSSSNNASVGSSSRHDDDEDDTPSNPNSSSDSVISPPEGGPPPRTGSGSGSGSSISLDIELSTVGGAAAGGAQSRNQHDQGKEYTAIETAAAEEEVAGAGGSGSGTSSSLATRNQSGNKYTAL